MVFHLYFRWGNLDFLLSGTLALERCSLRKTRHYQFADSIYARVCYAILQNSCGHLFGE